MSRFDRFWMGYGGLILSMVVFALLLWFGWSDLGLWFGW